MWSRGHSLLHLQEGCALTVGSFKSDRDGRCECGNTWKPGDRIYFKPGERGYWCWECEQERMGRYEQAEPKPEDPARQSSESPIEKGHRENMESAAQTRNIIAIHVSAVQQLRDAVQALTTEAVNLRSQIQLFREGKR